MVGSAWFGSGSRSSGTGALSSVKAGHSSAAGSLSPGGSDGGFGSICVGANAGGGAPRERGIEDFTRRSLSAPAGAR
jgi:hypothetical protein